MNGIPSKSALSLLVHKNKSLASLRESSLMLHRQEAQWFLAGNYPQKLDSIYIVPEEIQQIVDTEASNCQSLYPEIEDSWKGFPAKMLFLFPIEDAEPTNGPLLERTLNETICDALREIYYVD